MSMPTCWCSQAFPEDVITPLEHIYRQELVPGIPEVLDDSLYFEAYVNAAAGWLFNTLLWALERNLKEDQLGPSGPVNKESLWDPQKNHVRPRIITRLKAFIHVSQTHEKLPFFRSAMEKLLEQLTKLWPETEPLPLYPAFST